MLVKSRYCIELKDEIPYRMYSTKTGKLVVISPEAYKSIFFDGNYEEYIELVNRLKNAEILIAEDTDQEKELEHIRKETIERNNNEYISNYVITPTMACNARCSYCFEKDVHHETMNQKVADDIANYIVHNYVGKPITIHWFGGEPLLAPHIIDRISCKLSEASVEFAAKITTNGFYLSEDIVNKALTEWKVQYVQVTIDDIGENYNKIKNYKNSVENPFEIVVDNIKKALALGLTVRIRNNYDPENFEKPQEIIDFTWNEFEKNPNIIYHMHALFSDEVTSITGRFDKKGKHPFIAVLECEQKCEELISNNYTSKVKGINRGNARFTAWCDPRVYIEENEAIKILCKHMLYPVPVHCFGICDNAVAIDSRGDIFVCHSLLGKGKEYSSGNVVDGVMNNSVYRHYQNEVVFEKMCTYCNLMPLCHGGCKFKRDMYNTNQFCIQIKGCPEEALKHALEEIQQKIGTLEVIM